MEHKIKLITGFTDEKEGKTHKTVTFGRRLLTKDLIDLDNNPQAQNPTQYTDLIRRRMITKFGDLKMPVPLNALLALDSIDRADLFAAAEKFLQLGRGDRVGEVRENNEVKLRFGFEIDGTVYDVVKFGKLTTGKDEVEADALGSGNARLCFLIGRQIESISTEDGLATMPGAVDIKDFYQLDAEDFNLLRMGAMMFEASFRLKRTGVQGQRNGDDSLSAGARDENVGSGDSGDADGAH